MGDLSGKKILLGVSGSIAAYKSVFLVRSLQTGSRSQGSHDRQGHYFCDTTYF